MVLATICISRLYRNTTVESFEDEDDDAQTPGICAAVWSSDEDGSKCMNQKGCPSKACDGSAVSWCCNEGSVGCEEWHECTPNKDRAKRLMAIATDMLSEN